MKIPIHKAMDSIDTYHKGGEDDVTQYYPEVVEYLTIEHQCKKEDVILLDWCSSETCIYIKGEWKGYLSEEDEQWKLLMKPYESV